MVTAATAASSVSPPPFKMSMPFCSARTPFALDTMIGRVPFAVAPVVCEFGKSASTFGAANKFVLPAAAVPDSALRKNLQRDQTLMNPSCTAEHANHCEAATIQAAVRTGKPE